MNDLQVGDLKQVQILDTLTDWGKSLKTDKLVIQEETTSGVNGDSTIVKAYDNTDGKDVNNNDDDVNNNDDDDNNVGIDILETNPTTSMYPRSKSKTSFKDNTNVTSDNDQAPAAVRILNLFRMVKAMNIRNQLQSKFPTLYMVSVDKLMNIESLKNNSAEIFAYVSGLALINGLMKVISLSKTPSITAENNSHVALVTSDIPLAFICITIVKAKTTFGRSEEPLGIVSISSFFYYIFIFLHDDV